MPILAAFVLLAIGAVLAVPAATRIINHDDATGVVMVRYAAGFALVVAAVIVGGVSL